MRTEWIMFSFLITISHFFSDSLSQNLSDLYMVSRANPWSFSTASTQNPFAASEDCSSSSAPFKSPSRLTRTILSLERSQIRGSLWPQTTEFQGQSSHPSIPPKFLSEEMEILTMSIQLRHKRSSRTCCHSHGYCLLCLIHSLSKSLES